MKVESDRINGGPAWTTVIVEMVSTPLERTGRQRVPAKTNRTLARAG
jgi:hypothetical protein